MSSSALLAGLNPHQLQAVTAAPGCQLVLAGAGSGKTRVLTHRIVYLMQQHYYSPQSILAVTFTNKAAAEMRGRIEQLVGGAVRGMWIGTFHGLGHRLLRTHYREAGLPETFQILDSDDQQRLLKRLLRELNLGGDEKQWLRMASSFINGQKDEGLRPQHIHHGGDHNTKLLVEIYQAYENACQRAGVVDFAELLLRSYELLRDNPPLARHYRERFRTVLVDEFQDTNSVQYAWLLQLAGPEGHLTIVGDDDQSIYGWRGAKGENLQQFLRDFPHADTIRLEQNSRSTATILQAANALIANNSDRLGKELWTDGQQGEPIAVYAAFNEQDEARFVVGRIQQWREQGGALIDCAVLYRSNAQSRVMEEALIHAAVPYRIYGGLRFFDRQEIKDALAYLRLLTNRHDDPAFDRVINTPTRGIGDRTLELLRNHAREHELSLWAAATDLLARKLLPGRSRDAIANFRDLIEQLASQMADLTLEQQVDRVIHGSGLMAMYQQEKGDKGEMRVDNLKELVSAVAGFQADDELAGVTLLDQFLAHAALESGATQADAHSDAVQLMTLHSAKGLEFPQVFIVGVEEGLFPAQQSVEDPRRLEEERRLCYVGMTRAMQKLTLCHAESRRLYGRDSYNRPSRFLREIPPQFLEELRLRATVSRVTAPTNYSQNLSPRGSSNFENRPSWAQGSVDGFKLGQQVRHPKFGEGVILALDGDGSRGRVQVNFSEAGAKWLMVEFARLEAL